MEFVFLPREPGAQWLADCRARDVLDVVGPLGRPFPVPRDPASCLLLGVGAGRRAAVRARLPAGRPGLRTTDYLLGAESADRVFGALTARRTGRSAMITTADGSLGVARLGGGHAADRRAAGAHRRDLRVRAARRAALGVRAGRAGTASRCRRWCPSRPMTCGTGLCMGCVLPAVGNDGDHPHGPRVRGGPGVPRRPGALGRRGHDPVRRARRPRLEAAAGHAAAPGAHPARAEGARMPADLRTRIGHLDLPSPILTASGCAGSGPGARPVHRRRPDRRGDHQVGDA